MGGFINTLKRFIEPLNVTIVINHQLLVSLAPKEKKNCGPSINGSTCQVLQQ